MDASFGDAAAARLQAALDLYPVGVDVMRQQLRRRHPSLSREEIERRLQQWLEERPGAEFGDGEGRPVRLHLHRR